MRTLGTVTLTAGTILGALGGARLPDVHLPLTITGMALLVVSIFLLRKGDTSAAATTGGEGGDVLARIQDLVPRVEALAGEAAGLSLRDIGQRIDALDTEYLRPIADGSPSLLGRLGAERFAELAGIYASGERLLARAWSAATDHHRPETIDSLREAAVRLRAAAELAGTAKAA